MSVPKIIHQLWIGDRDLPINAMNSVKNMNPDYKYMFWCETTIAQNLNIKPRYQRKIEEHTPVWGKADMYRYLILEQYGGIFVDADMVCIEPFDDFLLSKAFFCWENEVARPDLCATSLQGYPPHHVIPKTAIDWIMNNNISVEKTRIDSWKLVGPGLLTRVYWEMTPNKSVVNVLPSYTALPDHHTGSKYKGHGKVYMTHEWGSTKNNYNQINTMKIPAHHERPENWIDIEIPRGFSDKKLKEVIQGIKKMEGHFGINIKCDTDIRKYLKSTRFVNFFDLDLELENKDMDLLNENNQPVNLNMEWIEQELVKQYIKPNDKVLELGARYGSVSITTNKILEDKNSHYVVEPDSKVWDCLERNMKVNNTEFNIIKGVIGKSKLEIKGQGYATHTIVSDKGDIDNHELPNVDFNVLIADCEGYLETFYNENLDFLNNLHMVIFETDRPEACDYDKIIKGLLDMGFSQKEKIPEPGMPGMYHYVFIKEKHLVFDTRKEMIKFYSDKIDKPKILELGVFKGEFLDYMVENLDYGSIEGVDLFNGIVDSGDEDGNNVEYVDLVKQHILLNDKYRDNENVNVYKTYTSIYLGNQPDNTYDIIYVDADHSYEGARTDILLAHQKIKPGGLIMGHDYEMNMDKAKTFYHFGVRQAVDEYCEGYNQEIIAKGMNGCVSFCIKVDK